MLFVVPHLGTRTAELLETPLMLTASAVTARWLRRHFESAVARPPDALAVGSIALAMLLGAEILLGMAVRWRPPIEVLLDHDPVSGTVYYASLLVFAFLPWGFSRGLNANQQ